MKKYYDERAALVHAMEELRAAAAKIDADLATGAPEHTSQAPRMRDAFNLAADFLTGKAQFYPEATEPEAEDGEAED